MTLCVCVCRTQAEAEAEALAEEKRKNVAAVRERRRSSMVNASAEKGEVNDPFKPEGVQTEEEPEVKVRHHLNLTLPGLCAIFCEV